MKFQPAELRRHAFGLSIVIGGCKYHAVALILPTGKTNHGCMQQRIAARHQPFSSQALASAVNKHVLLPGLHKIKPLQALLPHLNHSCFVL